MGNESSTPGVLNIPETDNLVKVIVLGTQGGSFTAIVDKLCPAQGADLIPQLGLDVRKGKLELRRQPAHLQYWLSDLNGDKEKLKPYTKRTKIWLYLCSSGTELAKIEEWQLVRESACKQILVQAVTGGDNSELTNEAIAFAEKHNMVYCEANGFDISGIEAVIRSLIIDIYTPKPVVKA